ncbi:hypothetical protein BSU04_03665 [Caballeronia sordidicola]|uniref:Uncharacterized protein n=1 Tax=Caballeronia sordidicola TaxID=196367 RepID=A0A226X8W5_CABSO|nr:hypothetical protein BSU04_03665 [Caballeronia sordidicola]
MELGQSLNRRSDRAASSLSNADQAALSESRRLPGNAGNRGVSILNVLERAG